jgi:hypothetical protein
VITVKTAEDVWVFVADYYTPFVIVFSARKDMEKRVN